jgi:hypothetical protein
VPLSLRHMPCHIEYTFHHNFWQVENHQHRVTEWKFFGPDGMDSVLNYCHLIVTLYQFELKELFYHRTCVQLLVSCSQRLWPVTSDLPYLLSVLGTGDRLCPWLQIQRSWVRFLALPRYLRSSGSGKGSSQPYQYNWGAAWKKYSYGDPLCWPRATLYPQKLALTSLTSSGRSVGIVLLWTKATEFVVFSLVRIRFHLNNCHGVVL